MAITIQKLPAIIMAIVFAVVFLGMGAYILDQIGTQGNISVIRTLGGNLGSWGTIWIPIILVVIGGAAVIGVLIRSFGGR